MARYTYSFTVAAPIALLRPLLVEILQAYNLEIIYDVNDYIMAREIPGQVSLAKLVTVEVLIDKTTATDTETHTKLVFKNEELLLRFDNHCHKLFELVSQAIVDNRDWQLIEGFAE